MTDHEMDDDDDPDAEQLAALWQTLEQLEDLGREDPAAAFDVFASLPEEVQSLADFQLLYSGLLRATGDQGTAREVLEALVAADPEDADAHHLLGDLLEDMGDLVHANAHFLQTLRLDSSQNAERSSADVKRMMDATFEHLRNTVEELPAPWRERLQGVPLLVQRLPTEDMVRAGLDPRAFGLFEGPTHADGEGIDLDPLLTRIVLFAENLAIDFPEAEDFAEQVRITVLHELGHYFGLDEDDMVRLGLD